MRDLQTGKEGDPVGAVEYLPDVPERYARKALGPPLLDLWPRWGRSRFAENTPDLWMRAGKGVEERHPRDRTGNGPPEPPGACPGRYAAVVQNQVR